MQTRQQDERVDHGGCFRSSMTNKSTQMKWIGRLVGFLCSQPFTLLDFSGDTAIGAGWDSSATYPGLEN